jgi:thioredoxin reductase (NADPH)
MAQRYDVIVLGAGPAGLTAGIYLGRNRLRTLIVDTATAGGQMVLSHQVANYPGVALASGSAISRTMLEQTRHFGSAVISQATITRLELDAPTKLVELEDEGFFEARALILAPGGTPRSLGLDSEQRFKGHGISYCATCDGDFFTGKPIVVVGGGNSALEEAVSLSRYASKVTLVHVLDEFQAQPWAVAEAKRTANVELHTSTRVLRFEGRESLERVVVRNDQTGQTRAIEAEGCFIFIGYEPSTAPIRGLVAHNARGEIVTDDEMRTSLAGVFAAGDARAKKFRQITTAVSDGTIAALSATDYLLELDRHAGQAVPWDGAASPEQPSVLGHGAQA